MPKYMHIYNYIYTPMRTLDIFIYRERELANRTIATLIHAISMDSFSFQEECFQGAMLYYSFSPSSSFDIMAATFDDTSPITAHTSAFEKYYRPLNVTPKSNDIPNVHRRVISYFRSIWKPKPKPKPNNCKMDESSSSREFRHMMRERHRREKLSQGYSELYSMLAPRSKADKNSIVQSATVYIKELKEIKEELHQKNKVLRERTNAGIITQVKRLDLRTEQNIQNNNVREKEAKIRVRMMHPVSTIDSMIGALQCMKRMEVTATSILSEFSGDQLTAMMTINTKVGKSEVERAVEGTLVETERKLRLQLPRRGVWAPTTITTG